MFLWEEHWLECLSVLKKMVKLWLPLFSICIVSLLSSHVSPLPGISAVHFSLRSCLRSSCCEFLKVND